MRVVDGRQPAATAAGVGVLLSAPALVWPVVVAVFNPPSDTSLADYPLLAFSQRVWAWGRVAFTGSGVNNDGIAVWNVVGLVVLAAAILIGALALVCWALVPGELGWSLGLAGTAALAAVEVGSAPWWIRLWSADSQSFGEGALVDRTVAGWSVLASIAFLLGGVALMSWGPLSRLVCTAWRQRRGGGVVEASVSAQRRPTGPEVGFADEPREGRRS